MAARALALQLDGQCRPLLHFSGVLCLEAAQLQLRLPVLLVKLLCLELLLPTPQLP
jgi:hypothetical protein